MAYHKIRQLNVLIYKVEGLMYITDSVNAEKPQI